MKKLNITHFILTLALLIVVIALGHENYRQNYRQRIVLGVIADALLTIQQVELHQLQPCGQEVKGADAPTLARK